MIGPPKRLPEGTNSEPSLAELEVSKTWAARWRRIAAVPAEDLEAIAPGPMIESGPRPSLRDLSDYEAVDFLPEGWNASEFERRRLASSGITVVANQLADRRLIQWAKATGILVGIGRGTRWGNPFIVEHDGTRSEVCDYYEVYFRFKPSLQRRLGELAGGKVLACWCHPERCHGHYLATMANGRRRRPDRQS